MTSLPEFSDDDSAPWTPSFLRDGSRFSVRSCTPGTPSSTSIVFGPISDEVMRIWSTLPEAIRLDPSLAMYQQEYESIFFNGERPLTSNSLSGETLIVNMSVKESPMEKANNRDTAIDSDNLESKVHGHDRMKRPFYRYVKLILLTCCWIIFTMILMTEGEDIAVTKKISVPRNQVMKISDYVIGPDFSSNQFAVTLESSLLPPLDDRAKANFSSIHRMTVWLGFIDEFDNSSGDTCTSVGNQNVTNPNDAWIISVLPTYLVDVFPKQKHEKIFDLTNLRNSCDNDATRRSLIVNFETNLPSSVEVSIAYQFSPINVEDRIVYGAIVLLGLYVLIVFEIVHRALAAMLASTMSLAILTVVNERPTMTELISWIDVDSLLLLFSMMILVATFAQTGVFDYLAVYAYKITGGKLWPLINTICFSTALMASLLDNVTTVMLMTPITIRLCEVMKLNPIPILTAMLSYSNIGGAATPVGDPPNVIVATNHDVIAVGVGFTKFVTHMGFGVIIVLMVISVQLRLNFRDAAVLGFDEPQDVQELRREIAVWQRAAASLSIYSKDENLIRQTMTKKINHLLCRLRKILVNGSVGFDKYKTTLEELQREYPIRDKWLLVKSSIALSFVIALFFLNNLPHLHLSLGWTALLGVLLLLVLTDAAHIDGLLARVEWSTLLFFASLFVLTEALARLGLIGWIGKLTENVILSVNEESRLAVAILLILWVSAVASAFVDNVPLVTMMIRIATHLAKNDELGLPLQPLVWALTFGACMGGNATLIGATANVVCAGIAEQHGYRFTFMQFFRFGFPIMLTSTATITVYLLIAHVVFDWM